MPQVAPIMKVQLCKQYGANVIIYGADIGEVSALYVHLQGRVTRAQCERPFSAM